MTFKNVAQIYKAPDIVQRTSPVYDNVIQDSDKIYYYFPGGANLLVISVTNLETAYVYIPPFSSITSARVGDVVREVSTEILAQQQELGIPNHVDFLFDVKTKKILVPDSFIDYMPYASVKNCVFMLDTDKTDDLSKFTCRYIADQTESGLLQFLALAIAKRDIAPPTIGIWSSTGKALLSFLVAKRYNRDVSFTALNGPWSSVAYTVKKNESYEPFYKKDYYRTGKAQEIVKSRLKAAKAPADTSPVDTSLVDPDDYKDFVKSCESEVSTLLFSDLVSLGVTSFTKGGYGLIDVTVDICSDIYKRIVIDGESGICFVTLNNGVTKSIEEIRDELEADNVEIVGDISV